MVVFVDGKPKKSEYRRFKVKTLAPGKIDDFASMEEVLGRRFSRVQFELKSQQKSKSSNLSMKPVETDKEWEAYHDIRENEVFAPHRSTNFVYNRDHPDEFKEKNHPMIFKLSGEIIGVIRLDYKTKTRLIFRVFGFRKKHQRKGYGTEAMKLVEEYALENGFKSIIVNAHQTAVEFYKKQNLEEGFWKGEKSAIDCVPMGKKIIVKKDKWELPDLVVIDGGKGQLSSVMKIFKDLEVEGFDPQTQVISLAKREEQIFRPGVKEPLELDFNSAALKLLQRLRDEAHRFAISFNRSLRAKSQTKSVLDEIPGIGPGTKKKLMQTFESVSGIRDASDEDLLKVLNKKQLNSLRRQL